MATGRSDYPNQINNVLCFPGIFRGALDAGAPRITEEMKLAAAKGIAEVVARGGPERGLHHPQRLRPRRGARGRRGRGRGGAARGDRPGLRGDRHLRGRSSSGPTRQGGSHARTRHRRQRPARLGRLRRAARPRRRGRRAEPRPGARAARPTRPSPGTLGIRPPSARRPSALEGVDGVVNLIGEPIDQRWTDDGEAAHPRQPRARDQEPRRRDQRRRAAPADAGQPVGASATTATAATRSSTSRPGPGRASTPRSASPGRRPRGRPRRSGSGVVVTRTGLVLDPSTGCSSSSSSRSSSASAARSPAAASTCPGSTSTTRCGLLLWALDTERASRRLQRDRPEPGHQPRVLEGARPRPGPPGVLPLPKLALKLQVRRRAGRGHRRRPAGGAAARARRRLRVPLPGARAGAPGPAAALSGSAHREAGIGEHGPAVAEPVAGEAVERRVAHIVDRVGAQHRVAILRVEEGVDDRVAVVRRSPGAPDRVERPRPSPRSRRPRSGRACARSARRRRRTNRWPAAGSCAGSCGGGGDEHAVRRGLAGRDLRTAEDPGGDPAEEGRSEHRVGGDQRLPRARGDVALDRHGNVGGGAAVVEEVRLARSGAGQAGRGLPERRRPSCRRTATRPTARRRCARQAASPRPRRPSACTASLGITRPKVRSPLGWTSSGSWSPAPRNGCTRSTAPLAGETCSIRASFVIGSENRRRAGVEVAEVGDRGRVLGRLPGVRGGHRRAPASAGATPGRVVEVHGAHRQLAHLSAGVGERQLGAVRPRRGPRPPRGRAAAC